MRSLSSRILGSRAINWSVALATNLKKIEIFMVNRAIIV